MRELGAQHPMKGKEFSAVIAGGHKLDIMAGNGFKICYNPQKRCWMAHGKKMLHEERDAKRYAVKLKEIMGG